MGYQVTGRKVEVLPQPRGPRARDPGSHVNVTLSFPNLELSPAGAGVRAIPRKLRRGANRSRIFQGNNIKFNLPRVPRLTRRRINALPFISYLIIPLGRLKMFRVPFIEFKR